MPMAAPSNAGFGAGVVQRGSAPAALLAHCSPPALGRTSRAVEEGVAQRGHLDLHHSGAVEVGKVMQRKHLDLHSGAAVEEGVARRGHLDHHHSGAVEMSKVVRSGRTARCLDPYFKAADVNAAAAQHLPCTFPAPSQHLPFLVPPANMPPMDKCSDKTTATGGFCSGGSGDDCLGGSVYDCFRPKMLTSSEIDADLRSLGRDGGVDWGGSYSAVREAASGGKRSLGGSDCGGGWGGSYSGGNRICNLAAEYSAPLIGDGGGSRGVSASTAVTTAEAGRDLLLALCF